MLITINRNAHYTLAGSIAIGTVVALSQRISLDSFRPYVPVSVAMSLLVTVHVVPWVKTFSHNGTTLGEYVIATGGDRPGGSYQVVVDSNSVQSSGPSNSDAHQGWNTDPLELAHMGFSGQDQTISRPYSPDHSSSLDLEAGLHQQAPSEAGSRDPFL